MQREARKEGLDGRHGLVHFLYLHSDTCTSLKRRSVKTLYCDLRQPCSSSCPERQPVTDSLDVTMNGQSYLLYILVEC